MSVMEKLDTELIEHLDFRTPCVVRMGVEARFGLWVSRTIEGPCQEPACWAMRCRRCGQVGVLCEKHHERVVALRVLTCAVCESTAAPLELFLFSPFGGC